jgi:transcriptional regulator with XRE-family HTH domain
MVKFGEKLRALRLREGFTLKQLAVQLGLSSHGYISEMECGKKNPTPEFIIGVAALFNVTTDELMKDEMEIDFKKMFKNDQ